VARSRETFLGGWRAAGKFGHLLFIKTALPSAAAETIAPALCVFLKEMQALFCLDASC